jgi:hypothetical protein
MGRPSKRKLQSRAAAKESIKYSKTNTINIALYHELEEAKKYFEIDEDPGTTSQFGQSVEIEEDIEKLLHDLNFSHDKTNFQSSQWRGFYNGLSEKTQGKRLRISTNPILGTMLLRGLATAYVQTGIARKDSLFDRRRGYTRPVP